MSVLHSSRSIRYKVVQGHFYHLVLSFQQSLPTTAAHLFEAQLIDSVVLGEAENANQSEFERSSALLRKILMKIEVDQKWYDVFLSVLHKVGINDLADDLKAACTKEEASVLHPVQRSSPVTAALVYSTPDNFSTPSLPNPVVQTLKAPYLTREPTSDDGAVHATELCKHIQELEEDKVRGGEEVERKGKEISEKNDRIARLEADCKDKDHELKVLKSDKAKMEKKIVDLEKKSRKEIQSVHDSYTGRLQKLQENLEDCQFRERKAKTDLTHAKLALAEARLEKAREISQLRVEFRKEIELAAREREITTRENLMLAEEKQKLVQDLVSYAEEEVNRAEEKTRQVLEAEMKAPGGGVKSHSWIVCIISKSGSSPYIFYTLQDISVPISFSWYLPSLGAAVGCRSWGSGEGPL